VLEGDGVDGHDDRLLRHGALQRGLVVGRPQLGSRSTPPPRTPSKSVQCKDMSSPGCCRYHVHGTWTRRHLLLTRTYHRSFGA
jgi:hypothetical protein